MVEDLPEYIQEELSELQSYFGSIEELCEHEDDIICHSGCDDMADVARYYLEESGQLGELPAHEPSEGKGYAEVFQKCSVNE